jgi:hypothetical protein
MMQQRRRQWWGYTDIGPVQMPPNPQYLILTDRTTGQLWWVTFVLSPNAPDGCGFVAISTVLPCNTTIDGPTPNSSTPTPVPYNNCEIFPAYGEPVLTVLNGATIVRLIVNNGLLGVSQEAVNVQFGIPNAPPLWVIPQVAGYQNPKVGYNGEIVQISFDPIAPFYTWTCSSITQTASPAPYNPNTNFGSQQIDD